MKLLLKTLCLVLSLCLLLSFAGCKENAPEPGSTTADTTPTESTAPMEDLTIFCENVAEGAAIKDIDVSICYGDTPLEHTVSWYISKDGERFEMASDAVLELGCYELHIQYKLQEPWPRKAIINDDLGYLIVSKQIAKDEYVAVVRYFFDEEA